MTDKLEAALAENAKLRNDIVKMCEGGSGPLYQCERCHAWLFDGDDFVSDEDGSCHGCWLAMTDAPTRRDHPCYAYRVGKHHGGAGVKADA